MGQQQPRPCEIEKGKASTNSTTLVRELPRKYGKSVSHRLDVAVYDVTVPRWRQENVRQQGSRNTVHTREAQRQLDIR